MRWLNFHCALYGHDDRVRRAPGRIFLECADCGRATFGWELAAAQPAPQSRRPRSLEPAANLAAAAALDPTLGGAST